LKSPFYVPIVILGTAVIVGCGGGGNTTPTATQAINAPTPLASPTKATGTPTPLPSPTISGVSTSTPTPLPSSTAVGTPIPGATPQVVQVTDQTLGDVLTFNCTYVPTGSSPTTPYDIYAVTNPSGTALTKFTMTPLTSSAPTETVDDLTGGSPLPNGFTINGLPPNIVNARDQLWAFGHIVGYPLPSQYIVAGPGLLTSSPATPDFNLIRFNTNVAQSGVFVFVFPGPDTTCPSDKITQAIRRHLESRK
jgi:hypothetical protein